MFFVFVVFVLVVLVVFFVFVVFVLVVLVVFLVLVVLFVFLIFVVLVVLVAFVVLVVLILSAQAPEIEVRGQIDDAARLGVVDQVPHEVGFQAGAVDEHHRRVGHPPRVARRRLIGVRIGARRQHHVQGDAVAPDPGDDVSDDGGRGDHR